MNKQNVTKISDVLSSILKWKKLLIINLFIISAVTTVWTFFIPEKFKSSATIMVEEDASTSLLSGVMSDVGSVLGGALFGAGGETLDKIFGFLESRKILLKVIDRFNLVEYYEIENYKIDKSLKAIKNDIDFDLTENGHIQISFIHKNPEVAAEIVNFIISELSAINKEFASAHATNYRQFVEIRYKKNLKDLAVAEEKFEAFQAKTGIYTVPEQFEIAFKALASLETELAVKELALEMIENSQGKKSSQYEIAFDEVRLMRKKINEISSGQNKTENSLLYLSLDSIPKYQKEYLRLYREIEIQTKLLEFTLPVYEQAVMEEHKDIPTIVVLDQPMVPELKDSPKKAYIIVGVFLVFFFIHILLVIIGDKSVKDDSEKKNLFEVKEAAFFKKLSKIYGLKI